MLAILDGHCFSGPTATYHALLYSTYIQPPHLTLLNFLSRRRVGSVYLLFLGSFSARPPRASLPVLVVLTRVKEGREHVAVVLCLCFFVGHSGAMVYSLLCYLASSCFLPGLGDWACWVGGEGFWGWVVRCWWLACWEAGES